MAPAFLWLRPAIYLALVLVGFVLPAPIGLFFVLMKPQMGFAMAIYWLVQAWKTGGIKKVALTFAPVLIVFGLSFLFFGNWITNRQPDLTAAIWNTSLWP